MMTAKIFMEELLKRRKNIPEQDIKTMAFFLSDLNPEILGKLMDAFDDYYSAERTPTRADLVKCAEKAGIRLNKVDKNFYNYVCEKCKSVYSFKSSGCPVCRKITPIRVLITRRKPDNFIACREDCWQCKHFGLSAIGVSCQEYGKGAGKDECSVCICRYCCREYYILRTNKNAYKEMMDNNQIEKRRL